jgi:hypothetical protein
VGNTGQGYNPGGSARSTIIIAGASNANSSNGSKNCTAANQSATFSYSSLAAMVTKARIYFIRRSCFLKCHPNFTISLFPEKSNIIAKQRFDFKIEIYSINNKTKETDNRVGAQKKWLLLKVSSIL